MGSFSSTHKLRCPRRKQDMCLTILEGVALQRQVNCLSAGIWIECEGGCLCIHGGYSCKLGVNDLAS